MRKQTEPEHPEPSNPQPAQAEPPDYPPPKTQASGSCSCPTQVSSSHTSEHTEASNSLGRFGRRVNTVDKYVRKYFRLFLFLLRLMFPQMGLSEKDCDDINKAVNSAIVCVRMVDLSRAGNKRKK